MKSDDLRSGMSSGVRSRTDSRTGNSDNALNSGISPALRRVSASRPLPHNEVLVEGVGKLLQGYGRASELNKKIENKRDNFNSFRTKKDQGIKIQNRDRAILKLMREQGFLSMSQVRNVFFPGTGYSYSFYRIKRLCQSGYVEKLRIGYRDEGIFRCSRLGHETTGAIVPSELTRRFPRRDTINHDIAVTDTRLLLQQFWPAVFYPENAIYDWSFEHRPDGVFEFPNRKYLALEVENSDKGRSRLGEVLRTWDDNKSMHFVLYVSANREFGNVILSAIRDFHWSQKFLFIDIETLAAGSPIAETPTGKIDLRKIGDT